LEKRDTLILGAGMTGLAAGWASGHPVFEALESPGGICSSYYVRPGGSERLAEQPADEESYRFELGGGHWIFGGDPIVLGMIGRLTEVRSYGRHSGIYFPGEDRYVPYPIQDHLHALEPETATKALDEMLHPGSARATMKEWLASSFGPTLCERFFFPFHQAYTAGLHASVAPQDAYKSPVDRDRVVLGASGPPPPTGYNTRFLYPRGGLDGLARGLAARCDVHYGRKVEKIDALRREVGFSDGTELGYGRLLSTLPLDRMMGLTGLAVDDEPDPSTSVLVLNVGARRGERCPDHHWLYVPSSRSGFHRVGFYSNVDRSFLPSSSRKSGDRVSLYIERTHIGSLSDAGVAEYGREVVRELQDWGYIGEVEAVDPTWIDVAYTWSWPGSGWREQALVRLDAHGIHQVGRYGRWIFQGIADSIRDGLFAGAACR
jgi:protoporphyrinogen oxidase